MRSVASESNSEGERDLSLLGGVLYSERSEVGSTWSDTFKNALSSGLCIFIENDVVVGLQSADL